MWVDNTAALERGLAFSNAWDRWSAADTLTRHADDLQNRMRETLKTLRAA
ncbi:MAG: hypothetical protein AAF321_09040 [Pseudomonadota bacterium]